MLILKTTNLKGMDNMIKEEDLTVEMVKYWIHLYKKIKSGEATELENVKLDDFTHHYLEYVENTGVFYVSHNVTSADGYLLGSNATSAKRRKQEGKMSDQTALKYDMLGFFGEKRKNGKPATILHLLGRRYYIL